MEIMDDHAPGRKVMLRPSGRRDASWVASPAAVKAGYRPKTVALTGDSGGRQAPPEVALRCRQMWSEMLEFLAGTERVGARSPSGTIAWLTDIYTCDADSPAASGRRQRSVMTKALRSFARRLALAVSTRSRRTMFANGIRGGAAPTTKAKEPTRQDSPARRVRLQFNSPAPCVRRMSSANGCGLRAAGAGHPDCFGAST
jgi:hypothetical protein